MQQGPERHLQSHLTEDGVSSPHRMLLNAADLAARRNLPELMQELSRRLHVIFDFRFTNYALHDPDKNVMRVHVLDESLRITGHEIEVSIEGSPSGWVWAQQQPLVLEDLDMVSNGFGDIIESYKSQGMRSLIILPMTTGRRRLGALGFGAPEPTHYDEATAGFLQRLAGLAALALENAITREAVDREDERLRALTQISIQLCERSVQEHKTLQKERERLETVLEINAALSSSRLDLKQIFPAISSCLGKAVPHDAAVVNLWNDDGGFYETRALGSNQPEAFSPWGWRAPGSETVANTILKKSPDGAVIRREELENFSQRFVITKQALDAGLVCWCLAPMRVASRLIGVVYLGSMHEDAFNEKDLDLVRQVAAMVAQSIENAFVHESVQREKSSLQTLLEISRSLTPNLNRKKLLVEIARTLRRVVDPEFAQLALYDKSARVVRMHNLGLQPVLPGTDLTTPDVNRKSEISFDSAHGEFLSSSELERLGSEFETRMLRQGFHTTCSVPVVSPGGALGTLDIASHDENAFAAADVQMLKRVAPQVAIAIENSHAYEETETLKDKLAKDKVYLEQEIREVLDFEHIIGRSPLLTHVLEQVKTVAPSDATVLILGETGTGKELIARAVHKLSPRKNGNFVKLNCAAIPTGLLESELFGHEKGAFTGAVSQKLGRLELADKGTLFLDEVGEIPLELQPKLLRALQDQEFERLGGTRTIRVNVRILSATNRDLAKAVAAHQFRSDLYYRLHVFPIRLPPLCERRGDIPLLVNFFVQKIARRMNKDIRVIPAEIIHALEQWHWPGNIRELENFMERSVILTEGQTLRVPVSELAAVSDPQTQERQMDYPVTNAHGTLEELERQYIVQVLRQLRGIVSGSQGAAARLGMKRTTLQSKMQRLGITREEYGQ
jgi:formate hydrogenlyase transcriptional activator